MSFYIMHRGWMEHHLFKNQPYSDREAWEYIIAHANFAPSKYRQANKLFDIPRGSIATSYRTLAEKWRWSTNKAIRFLNLLKNDGMISIKTEHNFLQINVINYDVYQNPFIEKETETDTESEQQRNTHGDRKKTETNTNVNKTKKEKEVKQRYTPPDWIRNDLWDGFMEVRKQKKAIQTDEALSSLVSRLERFMKNGHDPNLIIEASIRNSWKDVFEPKENNHAAHRTNTESTKSKWVTEGERLMAKYAAQAAVESATFGGR